LEFLAELVEFIQQAKQLTRLRLAAEAFLCPTLLPAILQSLMVTGNCYSDLFGAYNHPGTRLHALQFARPALLGA
jgi:hypothetical protein